MTDEHETAARTHGLVAELIPSVPSMNWNRAGGGGIRTLLRGSKPVTQARQRTTSPIAMEVVEETEEAKSSAEDVSSDPSDIETLISVSETGRTSSKTEHALPNQVAARKLFAAISQNDGADDASMEVVENLLESPLLPAPETKPAPARRKGKF